MRRLALGLAAASTALLPTAALAVTSGTLRGETTVTYSCDITLPTTQTMVVSGTTASIADVPITLTQNGDTDYSVTTLAITEPASATTSGAIVVRRADDTQILNADGIGSPDQTTTVLGTFSETGTVDFSQTETVLSAMVSGSYAVQTTMSCSETVGGA